MKKALATVVIGDQYVREWNSLFRPSWDAYAARHGYEIVPIYAPVDPSPRAHERSYNWQKLLVLEHPDLAGFDHVVWLDTDIMINPDTAPCIVTHHASDKVGLVSNKQWLYSNPERMDNLVNRRRNAHCGEIHVPPDHYRAAGLPEDVDDYSNTGVIVLNPSHRDVLRHVYDCYEENPGSAKEESPLSYHLYKHDLVKPLDHRFNKPWLNHLVEHYPFLLKIGTRKGRHNELLTMVAAMMAYQNNWFLHFTGELIADNAGNGIYLRLDAARVRQCDNIMALVIS